MQLQGVVSFKLKDFYAAIVDIVCLLKDITYVDYYFTLWEITGVFTRFAKGYHLRGLLLHAMGDHRSVHKECHQ
ncbi:hypothetical protein L1987_55911 [Smallanthus sonchifolius]|uniref:Uncharacterized protein n=1 Tax=Smallanthus sonchifolius TaxID=185202 RepID=A0ACB9EAQ4_9ASTR|nr:hypothetical protein L1987_55911 [Smallanthus sonchifolius]